MNNKPVEEQTELFNEFKDNKRERYFFKKNIFSSQTLILNLSYEKIVFITVLLLMVILVSFGLGVERGRYLGKIDKNDNKKSVSLKNEAGNQTALINNYNKIKYTIQLKVFSNEASAQKELIFLKSKGYNNGFILKSNEGFKLCLGLFSGTQDAEVTLLKIKARYKDSFIRKR